VLVKPAAHLDRLDEVMVITSTQPRFSAEQQQDLAMSESVKGAEAAEIKDQLKASQIMAERLPGLIDPNLPPDQQPLLDTSNPNPVAHPPQALHPDRFSPVTDAPANPAANSVAKPAEQEKPKTAKPQTGTPQTAAPRSAVPQPAKPKGNP
jgi:rod shape-determining protein MreC